MRWRGFSCFPKIGSISKFLSIKKIIIEALYYTKVTELNCQKLFFIKCYFCAIKATVFHFLSIFILNPKLYVFEKVN